MQQVHLGNRFLKCPVPDLLGCWQTKGHSDSKLYHPR